MVAPEFWLMSLANAAEPRPSTTQELARVYTSSPLRRSFFAAVPRLWMSIPVVVRVRSLPRLRVPVIGQPRPGKAPAAVEPPRPAPARLAPPRLAPPRFAPPRFA